MVKNEDIKNKTVDRDFKITEEQKEKQQEKKKKEKEDKQYKRVLTLTDKSVPFPFYETIQMCLNLLSLHYFS